MASAKKSKGVNFALARGIRMHGKAIRPYQEKTEGTGDKAKTTRTQTIITISENLARELAAASKGEVTEEKANFTFKAPAEIDDLAAAFGETPEK